MLSKFYCNIQRENRHKWIEGNFKKNKLLDKKIVNKVIKAKKFTDPFLTASLPLKQRELDMDEYALHLQKQNKQKANKSFSSI